MADEPQSMSKWTSTSILGYLLLSTALFLYLAYGLWGAVTAPIDLSPVEEPNLTGQAGPADGSPAIVQIDPEKVVIGIGRPTVRLFGHNFDDASRVRFDGVPRVTRLIDPNQLVVTLVASDYTAPGTIVVSVTQRGQTSNAATLSVGSSGEVAGVWQIFAWPVAISQEERLLLLVIFTGAFGASLMALRSLADYRGERKLTANWTIHYVVRPPLGAGVAFVFYLIIRGGFMAGTDVDVGASTPFGIVAVATLAGMYSEMAINKLREVFKSMFKADDPRTEGLEDLAIEATSLQDAKVGAKDPRQ